MADYEQVEPNAGPCADDAPPPDEYYASVYWARAAGVYECAHCGQAVEVADVAVRTRHGDMPLCPTCHRRAQDVGICAHCWGGLRSARDPAGGPPLTQCTGNVHFSRVF